MGSVAVHVPETIGSSSVRKEERNLGNLVVVKLSVQGTLTEGEGSIQLTSSLEYLVLLQR